MVLIAKELDRHGNRSYSITTPATVYPVSVDDVKNYGRIDTDAEDTLIEQFITAATDISSKWLWRSLLRQTITMRMDFWPGTVIQLPLPPLISVTGVYTTDEDDTDTEYSSDYYYLQTAKEPGELVIKKNVTAPTNYDRDYGGFKIIYVGGYGTAATDVPQGIRDGINLFVALLWENRALDLTAPPVEVQRLLYPFRVMQL